MNQTSATPATTASPAPLSKQDFRNRLAQGVILPDNFAVSDADFFANPVKTARLRPPLASEHPDQVATLHVIGLVPMILVLRVPQGGKPRASILAAFDKASHQELLTKLGRMSDEDIFELFSGSPRTLHQPRLRWSLL